MIQALKMAMKSIAGNKFRAFLTMLGIIIGVMALVILVSLVNGATGTVTDTIAKMGSDLIAVRISDDKGKPITLNTLDDWMETEGVGLIALPARRRQRGNMAPPTLPSRYTERPLPMSR